MNDKRLNELKEQVKYGIELYVDPIGQYLRTRPRQKPPHTDNDSVIRNGNPTSSNKGIEHVN